MNRSLSSERTMPGQTSRAAPLGLEVDGFVAVGKKCPPELLRKGRMKLSRFRNFERWVSPLDDLRGPRLPLREPSASAAPVRGVSRPGAPRPGSIGARRPPEGRG